MILPIAAYGTATLRRPGQAIRPEEPGLQKLIADMWETLDNAGGVGLAAPQVNRALRLFLVDSRRVFDEYTPAEQAAHPDAPGIRQAFLNAQILEYGGAACLDTEGCLSIPGIWETVPRRESITIRYQDEHFIVHTATFHGMTARMIQHEYDHTEGRLYLDLLRPLQRTLLKSKLQAIAKGKIRQPYPMLFEAAR